jgi:hypothetical protein
MTSARVRVSNSRLENYLPSFLCRNYALLIPTCRATDSSSHLLQHFTLRGFSFWAKFRGQREIAGARCSYQRRDGGRISQKEKQTLRTFKKTTSGDYVNSCLRRLKYSDIHPKSDVELPGAVCSLTILQELSTSDHDDSRLSLIHQN